MIGPGKSRYGCLNHHWSTSVLHCGKKAVKVVSFPGLPPHIISLCNLEKIKIGLVGEYHLLSLVCRPALVISTPLFQPLPNVDIEKQRFPDGGSFMISVFIELTANRFSRNYTIQMLIQLSSHFGGNSPILSLYNSWFWKSGKNYSGCCRFSVLLNSGMVLDMVTLEKPSSSAVLVTGPALRAPTICPFSNSGHAF